MPELPDIELYLHALRPRILDRELLGTRLRSPFLLRTFDPPLSECAGKNVVGLRRIGKRIVFELEDELFMVLHLMIAGRLQWRPPNAKLGSKTVLASFDFEEGALLYTEASKKKRAKLHIVRGEEALEEHNPGGLEPLEIDAETFRERLTRKNHTIKRALTDPRIFSGIGNSFSDEILFAAQVPPQRWTSRLSGEEIGRIYEETQRLLLHWKELLIDESGETWPKKVTAFHPKMNVHGRFGEPCNVCGEKVQRVAFAKNEMNYCAVCQNDGKLLADRGLSRLLKGDWPKTLEELEEYKRQRSE